METVNRTLIDRAESRICLEREPILATDAVRVMNDNVNQDEAVLLLGHPLKIAAEREVSSHLTDYKTPRVVAYLKQEEVKYQSSSSEWLIASVILAVFMVLLVLWLLFLMYKQYWVRLFGKNVALSDPEFWLQGGKKKHDILISSAGTSKHASPSAPRREICEDGAFTLDRGRGVRQQNLTDTGELRGRNHSDKSELSEEKERAGDSGGETPSLADHSGNNTPAGTRKTKVVEVT